MLVVVLTVSIAEIYWQSIVYSCYKKARSFARRREDDSTGARDGGGRI